MSDIWLLAVYPRVVATGLPQLVRLAGGGRRGYTQFGGPDWKAGLGRPPVISQRLGFEAGTLGASGENGAIVQALEFTWSGSRDDVAALAALYWTDADFTLHCGPDGGSDAQMEQILSGRIADCTHDATALKLKMVDPSLSLAKPVITGTFGGTGGLEGNPELKGQAKWRAWGSVFNVTLRSLEKGTNIWVATDPAFALQAFTQVYDKGNAASSLLLIEWAGTAAATLDALRLAVVPQGGAAVAPSIACIKWWYANPGKLTCDLQGEVSGGYVDRPADIAQRIAAISAGMTVNPAMLTAARTARDAATGWIVTDPAATMAREMTDLLSRASLWWAMSADGTIELGEWSWSGAPVATLRAAGIIRLRTFPPTYKVVIGWKSNETVMARADIAASLLDAVAADEAPRTFIQDTPPSAEESKEGDRWIDTSDNQKEYVRLADGLSIGEDVIEFSFGPIDVIWTPAGDHLADNTSENLIALDYPADRIIKCDAQLNPLTGQFPDVFAIRVSEGGASIKLSSRCSYRIDSSQNVTVSAIDNAAGSLSKGDVTVTGMTGSVGYVNAVVKVDGRDMPIMKIRYVKEQATGSVSGGTGAKRVTMTPNATVSSTSFVAVTPLETVTIAAGEKLYFTAPLDYYVSGSDGASRQVTIKHVYRLKPSGAATDVSAGTTGSGAFASIKTGPPEYDVIDETPGYVNATEATGVLSAGDYEVQSFAKLSAAGKVATLSNQITVEAKL